MKCNFGCNWIDESSSEWFKTQAATSNHLFLFWKNTCFVIFLISNKHRSHGRCLRQSMCHNMTRLWGSSKLHTFLISSPALAWTCWALSGCRNMWQSVLRCTTCPNLARHTVVSTEMFLKNVIRWILDWIQNEGEVDITLYFTHQKCLYSCMFQGERLHNFVPPDLFEQMLCYNTFLRSTFGRVSVSKGQLIEKSILHSCCAA